MIRQYGVLAYRFQADGSHRVLLITSRDTRRWVIPRGNLMAGLAANATAAQEAYEEAGVIGTVASSPVGSYDYVKRRKTERDLHASVQVFPMEVAEQKDDWPEKGQRELCWLHPETAAQRVEEPGLQDILRDFRPEILPDEAVDMHVPLPPRRAKIGWSIGGLFDTLRPRDDAFFAMLERHAATLTAGADAMAKLFAGEESIAESCRALTDLEHQADDVTREVLLHVRRRASTPLRRAAITGLISAMDDAIDEMRHTSKAVALYEVTTFEPEMIEMSRLAGRAAVFVAEAAPLLRAVRANARRLDRITEKIVHIEGEADDLHEAGMKKLFQALRDTDPMAFFVGRQIYIHLERVLDAFEDVANEVQGIVIDRS